MFKGRHTLNSPAADGAKLAVGEESSFGAERRDDLRGGGEFCETAYQCQDYPLQK
jgi:hypothetical protein